MIDVKSIILRINSLLNEDTAQSVTYAALESRLALEKVCYDRLRQRHAYISHAQLRKWQPGAVVKTLMAEVDPFVTETVTLYIGKNPDVGPESDEFAEIGTEIGLNPKYVADMWNALANLALHVPLPKHQDDHIPEYGDKEKIREKVKEVVAELERLSKGAMTWSGVGPQISFKCSCGEINRRRVKLLCNGQHLRCINPNCKETWKATKEGDDFYVEPVTVMVNCEKCQTSLHIPRQILLDMNYEQHCSVFCHSCQHMNHVRWLLKHVRYMDEK